jgi:hypothetical protein
VLGPDLGRRLDSRSNADPALASTCAYPACPLILLDLTCDLFAFAFSGIFSRSHAGQQSADAALDDSIIHFALTLTQRRVEHILLLGWQRALDVYFEPSEKEWAEDLMQFVDEHGVARFCEATGEGWNLEPTDSTVSGEVDGMALEDLRVLEGGDIVEEFW